MQEMRKKIRTVIDEVNRKPPAMEMTSSDPRLDHDLLAQALVKYLRPILLPKIEAQQIQPRWLSVESAGVYMDKTYQGMRYTLREFPKEIPISYIGDKPRIDRQDIDKFFLNRKGKK